MDNRNIIIFDGVCNFCNGSVNFIIRRDPDKEFTFTPMQSELAKELVQKHGIDNVGFDSFVLIKKQQCYLRTDAAIEIANGLTGYWYLFSVFKIVPRPIRDWFYRLFARNRYEVFGRTEYCMMPTTELMERFIGVEQK